MIIVLIDWHIEIGKEDTFKEYWRKDVPVQDRSMMVGEFLSRPQDKAFNWVTWDLDTYDASRFINVGIWASAEAFHEQIGRYFNPSKGKLDFEVRIRKRALLSPACWRMGDWNLPLHDSGGVL